MHIVFNHGKESGPNGRKIVAMSKVAESLGHSYASIDYTECVNEHQRLSKLENYLEGQKDQELVLVGSSMGGYVAAGAANRYTLKGLFLLCPAVYRKEFQAQEYQPKTEAIEIIHGRKDKIVELEDSLKFSAEHQAILHVVEDEHRLANSVPLIALWFKLFLERIKV